MSQDEKSEFKVLNEENMLILIPELPFSCFDFLGLISHLLAISFCHNSRDLFKFLMNQLKHVYVIFPVHFQTEKKMFSQKSIPNE